MSTDLMIDIETLSTKSNAHILSIGMVWFDKRYTEEPLIEMPIIVCEQSQPSSHIDAATVAWWMQQSDEAKKVFSYSYRLNMEEAVLSVIGQVSKADRIWAKDPDFDCSILASAVKNYSAVEFDWPFWKHRSVRTMLDIVPEAKNIPFEGTAHNALADANHQAKQMQHVFKILNSRMVS